MKAIRDLLDGVGDAGAFEERRHDVLDVDAAYRDWAETYDEPNPLVVAEERAMLGVLEAFPAGRAADVATGTGRLAARLAERGHDTLALDASDAMLARAVLGSSDVRFVRADLARLPLRDDSIDVLTCGLALTHVDELALPIEGFARVVAPGGVVVIPDIHPVAVATGAHAFFRRADGSRGVTRNRVHWPGAYVDAAVEAGLRVERCLDVLVDEWLLREFGVTDAWLDPEGAVLGLPFASIWVLRKHREG